MSTSTVDYDALAKKHGAVTSSADLDALAAKHGGSVDSGDAGKKPEPDGAIMANAKSFFGDLWDSVKHVPELFKPPQNEEEQAIHNRAGSGAPGLVIHRLANGYMGAVQQNVKRAEASADKGDNTGVIINSAAAGLPIVGPLVGGLYEDSQANKPGMVGKGLSRIVQAASLAPEGSAIPNPATGAVNLGVKAINKAAPIAQDVASGLYQSALKPSLAKNAPSPKAIVQTGLENKIPVSEGGIVKLGTLIDDLNQKISDVVKAGGPKAWPRPIPGQKALPAPAAELTVPESSAARDLSIDAPYSPKGVLRRPQEFDAAPAQQPGVTINPKKVASRLDELKGKVSEQVNPESDLATVEASKAEFLRNNPGEIPAAKAQAMKVGTYRSLGNKSYGEVKGAAVEAQKTLARGIKEEIASAFPELKDLNAQESKLFDLGPALEHAVNRIGNHQVVGIGTPAVAAGTQAVTKSSALAGTAATLKAVVDNPWVKSRLAIALSRAGKITPAAAKTRVAAYVTALANAADAGNSEAQSSAGSTE